MNATGEAGRGEGPRRSADDGPGAPVRDALLIVVGTLYLVLHAGLAWFLEHGA